MRVPSHPSALLGLLGVLVAPLPAAAQAAATTPLFHDAHFHLTNYIQEGTDIRAYLEIMGTRIGRSALVGIPLQQQPALGHVYYDLAWAEVGKYVVSSPEAVACVAGMINARPDRCLFGSDVVAPTSAEAQMKVYEQCAPGNGPRPERSSDFPPIPHEGAEACNT